LLSELAAAPARKGYGIAYDLLGNRAEAEEAVQEALARACESIADLRDPAAALDALKHYDELLEATRKGNKPYIADDLRNEHAIVKAWVKYASGERDEGARLLRSVADTQDKVGKRETELPAREMLADMLLDMQHPQEALAEYETSLRTDPNRFNGLYGAAQAAEISQQKQKAAAYYSQLLKNCVGSHSDRPELTQAKTLLAAK